MDLSTAPASAFASAPASSSASTAPVRIRTGRGLSIRRLRLLQQDPVSRLPQLKRAPQRRSFLPSWSTPTSSSKKYSLSPQSQEVHAKPPRHLPDPRDESPNRAPRFDKLRRHPSCKDMRLGEHSPSPSRLVAAPPTARPENVRATFRGRLLYVAKPMPATARRPSPPSGGRRPARPGQRRGKPKP